MKHKSSTRFRQSITVLVFVAANTLSIQCGQPDSTDAGSTNSPSVTAMTLSAGNGSDFTALVSGPNSSDRGVILIHDWFGVTEFTRRAVARFGTAGFRAVAVDLYDGRSAVTHEDAFALMKTVDKEAARSIIESATGFLAGPNRKTAVVGYSMGAEFAIETAIEQAESVAAAVVWYGGAVTDSARLARLSVPVLAIGGGRDNPESLYQMARILESMDKSLELHIYPGLGHAFAQPLFNEGKNFDSSATESSWLLTEDFLGRHMTPMGIER